MAQAFFFNFYEFSFISCEESSYSDYKDSDLFESKSYG